MRSGVDWLRGIVVEDGPGVPPVISLFQKELYTVTTINIIDLDMPHQRNMDMC